MARGPDEIFDVNYAPGTSGPRRTVVREHGGGWVAGGKDGIADGL